MDAVHSNLPGTDGEAWHSLSNDNASRLLHGISHPYMRHYQILTSQEICIGTNGTLSSAARRDQLIPKTSRRFLNFIGRQTRPAAAAFPQTTNILLVYVIPSSAFTDGGEGKKYRVPTPGYHHEFDLERKYEITSALL